MRKEQYLAVLAGLSLVFALYFFGRTVKVPSPGISDLSAELDFPGYESLQLQELSKTDADAVIQLRNRVTLNPTPTNYLELSQMWQNLGNHPLGAYYYHEAALYGSDSIAWESVGDRFTEGYQIHGDSLIMNNLINFAIASYQRAYDIDPTSIVLKMKLAETYVESPDPMKGIVMLREIADSIPDYVPAQMSLGRLSIRSGQYDKAATRFQHVLQKDPVNTEAMYFMALASEGLGNMEEAVRWLEMCKQLVGNPVFSEEIDRYIEQLKD